MRKKRKEVPYIASQRVALRNKRRDNPEWCMHLSAKDRAGKSRVPFDLKVEDIIIPEVCPVLDIPLERHVGRGPKANSPTLDRIKPELGYVKDNVRVISNKANRIKSDATPEEIMKVAVYCMKEASNGPK